MVNAQLSLFDTTAAEVGSFYKAGDWVKLRRKPAVAAGVKRGEIYKINAVHPIDGSMQFWNPFTNQWDFLYPDEVRLSPPPADFDSPTPAEVAVGESNCPPGDFDSPTSAEVAVGESNCPPGDFDSPTSAEVAVGESNCPHTETNTTTHDDAVGESNCPPVDFDSPTSAELAVGESNCPPVDDCLALHAISTYRPRGTARGGEYFRLSYKDGGKVRTVHIRGGNTDSPIAQAKVQEVRSLLAVGIAPREIAARLRNSSHFRL